MNYILSNQDTVLGQITQLESSITQTEVTNTFGVVKMWLKQLKAIKNVHFYKLL